MLYIFVQLYKQTIRTTYINSYKILARFKQCSVRFELIQSQTIIVIVKFYIFLPLSVPGNNRNYIYLVRKHIQDTSKINTLSKLCLNWFTILYVTMMIKLSLYTILIIWSKNSRNFWFVKFCQISREIFNGSF